jgi:hypothetical protein
MTGKRYPQIPIRKFGRAEIRGDWALRIEVTMTLDPGTSLGFRDPE